MIFGLLFGLAAGFWAVEFLLIPAMLLGLGWWAIAGYMRTCDEIAEIDVEIDAERAAIAQRADQQHQQVIAGKPAGMYGLAWQAQREYECASTEQWMAQRAEERWNP